ncbi:SixA phosphatase family protein [Formosa haliotis]|uniref:SixA phosphatase family protein n=1 Tax=Formosa haliotis TaxID=1555194 RepID=UPI0009F641FC|nr:phosphoglycerate mutase family protein [Formosa haliotis]
MKLLLTISFLFFSLLPFNHEGIQPKKNSSFAQAPTVVYLVRHAEKANLTTDPELSESGKERAKALMKILKAANINHVHSTDYIRTRDTAEPTANAFGLTPEIYDPSNLKALADRIREEGGNHVIVGHSNTTPKMVELLGGDPGSAIDDASEFDRLYIVTISGNNEVQTKIQTYGAAYTENKKH